MPYNSISVKQADLQDILYECTSKMDAYNLECADGIQQLGRAYILRLDKRKQALIASEIELENNKFENRRYKINSNTLGFLQASNINYAAFDNARCTQFQHCITEEIIGILNSSADMACRNSYGSIITQFAQYNCNLAVSAQQLNQLSHVKEAVAITDISHVFQLYGQAMLDDELEAAGWKALGVGVATGSARALYKWAGFIERLCNEPRQTIGKLSQDCYAVGSCLIYAAAEIGEFTPFAYLDDITKDVIEGFKNDVNCVDDTSCRSRVAIRNARNL